MKKQRIETSDYVGEFINKKFSKILFPYIDKIFFMSPNFLTTLRNILVIYIYYSIIKKKYFHNQGLLVILVGILDILDGCYARDYNMTTSFGDWYDHISDWISTVILFYILFKTLKNKKYILFPLLFLIFTTLNTMCSEKLNNKIYKKEVLRNSLQSAENICPFNTEKEIVDYLKKYRYFGYGTYYLVMGLIYAKLPLI
jgi:hypothetical protein